MRKPEQIYLRGRYMENQLIHRMKVNDDMAVLDINSGAVHLIDKVT